MPRSIFGWSYPPGVTSSTIEAAYGHEGPCQCCGKALEVCECPECPECSTVGCLEHMSLPEITKQMQTYSYLASTYEAEFKKRQVAAQYQCKCGYTISPDLLDGGDWCPKCGDYAEKANVYVEESC